MIYCDLVDTGKTFKGNKIYKCERCGLEAGLDSPDGKILCFAANADAHVADLNATEQMIKEAKDNDIELRNKENFHDPEAIQEFYSNNQKHQKNPEESIATEEQINERMDICNSCEHYKDEACMLCGCRVVRSSVYQNKLADKSASCPDGRWGPIKD